jgi:hypothetical protein
MVTHARKARNPASPLKLYKTLNELGMENFSILSVPIPAFMRATTEKYLISVFRPSLNSHGGSNRRLISSSVKVLADAFEEFKFSDSLEVSGVKRPPGLSLKKSAFSFSHSPPSDFADLTVFLDPLRGIKALSLVSLIKSFYIDSGFSPFPVYVSFAKRDLAISVSYQQS